MDRQDNRKPAKRRSRWRQFATTLIQIGGVVGALSQILALVRELSTFV